MKDILRSPHLPIVPPFGINDPPILKRHQELATFILDIHKATDEVSNRLQSGLLLLQILCERHYGVDFAISRALGTLSLPTTLRQMAYILG